MRNLAHAHIAGRCGLDNAHAQLITVDNNCFSQLIYLTCSAFSDDVGQIRRSRQVFREEYRDVCVEE